MKRIESSNILVEISCCFLFIFFDEKYAEKSCLAKEYEVTLNERVDSSLPKTEKETGRSRVHQKKIK